MCYLTKRDTSADGLLHFSQVPQATRTRYYMTVPAKTKVLSHWHTDHEAIFVCVGGQGVFVLDDMEWSVSVGDALFIPLTHVHGIANPCAGTMELLDLALFSELESNASLDECRSPAREAQWERTKRCGTRPISRIPSLATRQSHGSVKCRSVLAESSTMVTIARRTPGGIDLCAERRSSA